MCVCVCCCSGNGCGHTALGVESGTLASQNYPRTYPSNVWCKWRLRVAEGRTLRLLFGDFDIEDSPGCANGSLVITGSNGEPRLGNVDELGRVDSKPDHWWSVGALAMVEAVPRSLSQHTRARPPSLPGGHKNWTAREKDLQSGCALWLFLDSAGIVGSVGKCCYMSVV